MEIRDAVEEDAEQLSVLADAPADVMRNLVHDRTVRVVEPRDDTPGDRPELEGFVSYDARGGTVYVTQLGGTAEACERLLNEPIRFATSEDMAVELLVEEDDDVVRAAAERVGFSERGPGPAFDGSPTVRYRIDAT